MKMSNTGTPATPQNDRRAVAQTRAAAALRGYLARSDARRNRARRGSAATFVARAWRRRMHRLNLAAGKLQAIARGADGRRRARELRVMIRCAIAAQSAVSQPASACACESQG